MVLVYMLTKMGYIDGIHVTIYSRSVMGSVMGFKLPSGNLTVRYGKIHHAIHGKIHYFNGHFQ